MKKTFLASVAVLSASAAFAQNSVSISQSSERQGNQAVVSQSGSGNSIVINQSNTIQESTKNTDQKKQPRSARPDANRPSEGNQVSLRVDNNTQTTINQDNRSDGSHAPNSVELWQSGNSETTINQSSATHENTVVTHPYQDQPTPTTRSTKRRNRP